MAVQTLFSFFNWAAYATITGTTAPYQAAWPASNLRFPQQPFVLGKTQAGIGAPYDTVVDLGGAVAMEFVMVVNVNYTLIQLYGSNDPTFGTLVWATPGLTLPPNPWTQRYHGVHVSPGVAPARYFMLRIVSNVPTDGLDHYTTGGLWIGTLASLPSDLRWDERLRVIEPHVEVPLIGGGTHRVKTGRPYVEMQAQRQALTLIDTPATGDELGSWLLLDHYMRTYDLSAWYLNRGNRAEAFIFRKMNASNWNVNQILSEDELILHEVVGP